MILYNGIVGYRGFSPDGNGILLWSRSKNETIKDIVYSRK